jgi:high-affinity Fe2+/Pb2+ permease
LTEPKEREKAGATAENIFSIVDRLVYQIDRTKKFILVMIIAVIVAIPLSWHVSPFLLGMPYGYSFRLAGVVAIVIAAIFLVIGARQWMLLSDWTRKYKAYKERQKKIDDKLDFEDSNEEQ